MTKEKYFKRMEKLKLKDAKNNKKKVKWLVKKVVKKVKNFLGYNYCSVDLPNELELIEKSLKALEIIKEKRVACDLLTNPDVTDYKKYNSHCDKYDFIVPLTEEEFNLLKECLE